MEVNKAILKKEVKKCANWLGLNNLRIKISTVIKKSKYDIDEYFASTRAWGNGYLIKFNLPLIKKKKINEQQLRGLIIHELMHSAIQEYRRLRTRIILLRNKQKRRLYSNEMFHQLDQIEEILIDLFTINFCLMPHNKEFKPFLYTLPSLEIKAKRNKEGKIEKVLERDVPTITRVKKEFKEFVKDIKEWLNEPLTFESPLDEKTQKKIDQLEEKLIQSLRKQK